MFPGNTRWRAHREWMGRPRSSNAVRASIVIRAKNEARFIGEVLEAVFGQRFPGGFELVVVDSGSTDGTLDILGRHSVRLVQIPAETFTYGRSLNLGIAAARGELIASLSAHSTPAHDRWLANLLEPFDDPDVAGVYGRQLPRPNATPLELLGMRLSGLTDERPRRHELNPMFSNANGAFRRALCLEVPFDEQVGGAEDLAWARLMLRAGYVIAYQPTAPVYHSHGEPLLKHLRRTLRDQPTFLRAMLGARGGARPPIPRRALFREGR
jgi:glycosyltransferase involved in cell wall biosynthesis